MPEHHLNAEIEVVSSDKEAEKIFLLLVLKVGQNSHPLE